MVHHESHVQSQNESPGQTSPQPPLKRKKLDDDDLNGSKKVRTRVRFVLLFSFKNVDHLISSVPVILVENATAVSRRYVQSF
jgi:hypothetical protein